MKTFSITDVGLTREVNQDYMFTSENPVGNLPNLFIVADGMGGHNAGDYASRYTVDTIVDTIKNLEEKNPEQIIKLAVSRANQMLLKKSNQDIQLQGMGTTVVVLSILDNRLLIANVGDSRLYIVNRQQINQVTKDHSYVQEMVRIGEMDEITAREHPDKNIITRAIGVTNEVLIDFFEEQIKTEDIVLMCSDGLTNMILDEDIKTIINSQRDVVEMAEKLVETANNNGGKDNITVVIIEPFSDEVKKC